MMNVTVLRDFLWPRISDAETAKKAADQGFMAAILYVILTLGISLAGQPLQTLDILMVALCGTFAKRRQSRLAAITGLALMVRELGFSLRGESPWLLPTTALLVLLFVNSVRGTFAYHREILARQTRPTVEVLPPEPPREEQKIGSEEGRTKPS